jgi:hypothetical protein
MTEFLEEMGLAYTLTLLLVLMTVLLAAVSVFSERFARKGRARKKAALRRKPNK